MEMCFLYSVVFFISACYVALNDGITENKSKLPVTWQTAIVFTRYSTVFLSDISLLLEEIKELLSSTGTSPAGYALLY